MMATKNNCRKFEPNIFNKAKCQNCFKPKETHSAEALECNKQSRKISKCGYLFVAPESFDFTCSLDKTRRWQRRFVVLYDDGELTYSVDENVNTVPQGVIDMNICTDVHDAENSTSHQYSICVKVPDRTTYIKGTTKDEINRWFDVLVMYPRSIKTKKHRRTPTYHGIKDAKQGTKRQRYNSSHVSSSAEYEDDDPEVEYMYDDGGERHSRGLQRSRSDRGVHKVGTVGSQEPPPIHYRGIRSLKHKHDKSYHDGLKKSSSLHDLSAQDDGDSLDETAAAKRHRARSKSGDRTSLNYYPAYRRRTDPHPIVLPREDQEEEMQRSVSPPPMLSTSSTNHPSATSLRQGFAERHSEDTGMTQHFMDDDADDDGGVVDDGGEDEVDGDYGGSKGELYRSRSPTSSLLLNGKNKNETDERKMAKTLTRDTSSPRQSPVRQDDTYQDDLKYMKKGWLLKQRTTEMDWVKHWFVLSGSALRFYKDSRAEELEILDGMIDLTQCYDVKEMDISRNYGFLIRGKDGDTLLSAMTSGIRTNWMQAVEKCLDTHITHSTLSQHQSNTSNGQVNSGRNLHSSMPDRGITHPAFMQQSQDMESLSQSYPAVRLRPKVRDTRSKTLQENRRSLDLSSLGQDKKPINRHLTVDDYSLVSRRFDSDDSLERTSHDSLERGSQESLQSGHSESSQLSQGGKVKRRRRRDKQHKSSCTWPYQSSDGFPADGAQNTGNLQSQDSGSKSELLEYIGQTEAGKVKKALSPQEQNELDNVEKNIRRIHRKSITEVQHHKPQHYDKFETGTAFHDGAKGPYRMSLSERIMADYTREEIQAMHQRSNTAPEPQFLQQRESSPSGSSQSSTSHPPHREFGSGSSPRSVQDSPQVDNNNSYTNGHQITRGGSNPHEEFVRKKSPSAKIKERTKAKQQQQQQTVKAGADLASSTSSLDMDMMEELRQMSGDSNMMNDIIEQKWRESDEDTLSEGEGTHKLLELENVGPATLKSPSSSVNGETTVEDLLEIEVETLKTRLERTQTQLENVQSENNDLKANMKTSKKDHSESMTDLEKDQSRYVNQINDIQDQMEHTTEFFQSKIAEHENKNEMAKLQLSSLRSQLHEARTTISTQKDEMNSLKTKLEMSSNDLGQCKTKYGEKMKDREREKQQLEQRIATLEGKIHDLESDLLSHTATLSKKDSEAQKFKDMVKKLMGELEEKNDRIEGLDADIQDVLRLKQELDEKSSMVAHLHEELDLSKQQLRAQDEVLQKKEKDYSNKAKELEDEFYKEKETLEETIQQLKDRLNKMIAQSDRADSFKHGITDSMKERDETIAQLEEKLIENDTKMEELKVELSEVTEENIKMQQSLKEDYNSGASLKQELEQSKKEIQRYKNQLTSVNTDVQDMKTKKDKLVEENKRIHNCVETLDSQNKDYMEEIETLKTAIHDYNGQMQEANQNYMEKCEEYEELQAEAGKLEESCTTAQVSLEESEKKCTALESQVQQLQSQQSSQSSTDEAKQNLIELERLKTLVTEYTNEAKAWQDKYIQQCDECERLNDSTQKYNEVVEQLATAQRQVEELKKDMEEQKDAFEKDMEEKYHEVLQSQDLVDGLQSQLTEGERNFQEQTSMLEQLREREFLQGAESLTRAGTDEQLTQKYKDTMKDLKQTRKLLQETERKRDELESNNHVLKQELKNIDIGYQDQMNGMREKITELTNKLTAADRRLKRYERRKSGAPDEEEVQMTLANGAQEPVIQAQTQSQVSSAAPDSNLQAKLTGLESSLQAAENKLSELSTTKQELVIAQAKIKDLSTQILDQRCLEIDLAKLKSTEISLREHNSKLEEEINLLKGNLQEVMTSKGASKDKANLVERLVEVELRFKQVQSTLQDCQDKISSVIQEIKSPQTLSKSGVTLKSVHENIEKVLSYSGCGSSSISPSKSHCLSLTAEDKIRLYAEKLALEALVLGELAYNVKVNETDMFGGQDCVLYEIELANHRLLNLEQTVNTIDNDYSLNSCQHRKVSTSKSLESLSSILSQKIQLQQQVSELIEKDKQSLDQTLEYHLPHGNDETIDELGQEALFRIFLDEKLLSESSQNVEVSPLCMFSKSTVQCDLAVIQAKVKECLSGSVSQKQKEAFVQSEVSNRFQVLQVNQRQCNQTACQFVDKCVETLAKICAEDVVQMATSCQQSNTPGETLLAVAQKVFDKEQVQSEVTLMVNKYARSYKNEHQHTITSKASTESLKEKTALVIDCVQKETSELCVNLVSAIEQQLKTLSLKGCQVLSQSDKHNKLLRRNSLAMGLCNVVAQKSMLNVQMLYVEQLLNQSCPGDLPPDSEFKLPLKRNDSGVVVHSMSLPTSPTEQLYDQLVASLQQEAHVKSDIASYLLNNTATLRHQSLAKQSAGGGLKEQIATLACELVGTDRHLLKASHSCGDYADFLGREAIMQAQLSYSINLLRIKHLQEMEGLKHELDSSQSLLKSKQSERILDLEDEIDRLTCLMRENEAEQGNQSNMDYSVVSKVTLDEKADYDKKIKSLKEELNSAKSELEATIEEREEESNHYEQQMETLEKQVTDYKQEIERLQKAHEQMQSKMLEASKDGNGALLARLQGLETRTQNIQTEHEKELADIRAAHRKELDRTKDEMLSQIAAAEAQSLYIDEDSIRKKYMTEIERIKGIYVESFSSMEKSHQKVILEMRKSHKKELDQQRADKEQLLTEETMATQAALDVMRKAHENELHKERNKFLDTLAKTYSHADVESLQRQHEENVDIIQKEIKTLSEQYSIKLIENSSLEKRVQVQAKSLHESRNRVQDLMAKNEELNSRLRHEIGKLSKMVSGAGNPLVNESEPPHVNQLRIALRVKDAELVQLKDEMNGLKDQLDGTVQELEDSLEKYHELYDENQNVKKQHKSELAELQAQLDRQQGSPGLEDSEDTEGTDDSPRDVAESMKFKSSLFSEAGSQDSVGGRSPSPKRSKFRASSPDRVSSASSSLGSSSVASGGRQLPEVAPEARNVKRALWRQRHPERARSNPGPVPLTIPTFSLPSKLKPAASMDAGSGQVGDSGSLERQKKKKSVKMGSVDIIEEL